MISIGYERPEHINLYLNRGYGQSLASRGDIQLFEIDLNTPPIVHELTHVLFEDGWIFLL
ncbi:hypothetical protein [Cytobacillus purgationiresistens]|uniref:hypothetical protein n=1 Tax=Cytobacillus purgationiresistens TaxID=863449 RepID=UPI0027D8D9E3|nr:hypothetical protein [Cytobacillus purgationiresistens]